MPCARMLYYEKITKDLAARGLPPAAVSSYCSESDPLCDCATRESPAGSPCCGSASSQPSARSTCTVTTCPPSSPSVKSARRVGSGCTTNTCPVYAKDGPVGRVASVPSAQSCARVPPTSSTASAAPRPCGAATATAATSTPTPCGAALAAAASASPGPCGAARGGMSVVQRVRNACCNGARMLPSPARGAKVASSAVSKAAHSVMWVITWWLYLLIAVLKCSLRVLDFAVCCVHVITGWYCELRMSLHTRNVGTMAGDPLKIHMH